MTAIVNALTPRPGVDLDATPVARLRKLARREVEALAAVDLDLMAAAVKRAGLPEVFVVSSLTMAQAGALYGAARAIALIAEVSP